MPVIGTPIPGPSFPTVQLTGTCYSGTTPLAGAAVQYQLVAAPGEGFFDKSWQTAISASDGSVAITAFQNSEYMVKFAGGAPQSVIVGTVDQAIGPFYSDGTPEP